MKALVTGGTGFIGSHLTKSLCQRGYDVTVCARHAATLWYSLPEDVEIRVADLAEKESLRRVIGNFDYVYHVAAARDSMGRAECYKTNVEGTRNLLELLAGRSGQLKKFVYVSSLGAAGFSRNEAGKKETDPLEPVSFYGQTKMLAEKEVMRFAERIPYIVMRPPKVYGPGDRRILFHFKLVEYGVVPDIGLESRFMSLCYVEDLVNALIMSAESGKTDGIYFVSDGNIYSWQTFYSAIARVLNKRMRTLFIPRCLTGVALRASKIIAGLPLFPFLIEPTTWPELASRYWTCNADKVFKDFPLDFKTELETGLKKTAEWLTEKKLL